MSEIIINRQKSDPNVVPLCDILLVLLIIFMVITPTLQKGMDVILPETGVGQPPFPPVVLTIDRDMKLAINQQAVDLSLLEGFLSTHYSTRENRTIFVQADRGCVYRDVVKILDICRGAGIGNICMMNP